MPWIVSSRPRWQKKRTSSYRLSSNIHILSMTHVRECTHTRTTLKYLTKIQHICFTKDWTNVWIIKCKNLATHPQIILKNQGDTAFRPFSCPAYHFKEKDCSRYLADNNFISASALKWLLLKYRERTHESYIYASLCADNAPELCSRICACLVLSALKTCSIFLSCTPLFAYSLRQVLTCSSSWSETHYIAKSGLELLAIFLPHPPKCWNYRHKSPHLVGILLYN